MMKNEAKAGRHLREANNAFKVVRTEKPVADYEIDQQSLHDNHERLGDGRHGQGTATRQSRSQEAEEGKAKVIAAQPSRKEVAWQPDFGSAKKEVGGAVKREADA